MWRRPRAQPESFATKRRFSETRGKEKEGGRRIGKPKREMERKRGWEVPQGGRESQPSNTSRPDQTELIDLESLSVDSVRVVECPAPATGKSGEAPAVNKSHPGSEIDSDSCYSEDWVLSIVDLLLGRCSDCGLGSLASSFCKGRER